VTFQQGCERSGPTAPGSPSLGERVGAGVAFHARLGSDRATTPMDLNRTEFIHPPTLVTIEN
jgi:hypothetical protein